MTALLQQTNTLKQQCVVCMRIPGHPHGWCWFRCIYRLRMRWMGTKRACVWAAAHVPHPGTQRPPCPRDSPLASLQRLPVQPREGEELDRLIKKFDRWAVSLGGAQVAAQQWEPRVACGLWWLPCARQCSGDSPGSPRGVEHERQPRPYNFGPAPCRPPPAGRWKCTTCRAPSKAAARCGWLQQQLRLAWHTVPACMAYSLAPGLCCACHSVHSCANRINNHCPPGLLPAGAAPVGRHAAPAAQVQSGPGD